jgi:hypothetical protein
MLLQLHLMMGLALILEIGQPRKRVVKIVLLLRGRRVMREEIGSLMTGIQGLRWEVILLLHVRRRIVHLPARLLLGHRAIEEHGLTRVQYGRSSHWSRPEVAERQPPTQHPLVSRCYRAQALRRR